MQEIDVRSVLPSDILLGIQTHVSSSTAFPESPAEDCQVVLSLPEVSLKQIVNLCPSHCDRVGWNVGHTCSVQLAKFHGGWRRSPAPPSETSFIALKSRDMLRDSYFSWNRATTPQRGGEGERGEAELREIVCPRPTRFQSHDWLGDASPLFSATGNKPIVGLGNSGVSSDWFVGGLVVKVLLAAPLYLVIFEAGNPEHLME